MASKKVPVPAYAQAVISKCELCDRGAEARYFCNDCQEDMCKQCKITHQRSKLSRNHTVISSAEEIDEERPVFCTSHPREQVQMYCNDCNVPVCHTCIADKEHPNHDLVKIADAVDKCRKELSKCISDTKQQISELEGALKNVSKNKEEYETQHNATIVDINNRRQELKSVVDKAADDCINEAEKHKNQDIIELEKQSDDIIKIISDKRAKIESCEEMLQTERGFPIIQLSVEFKHKLDLGSSRNLSIPICIIMAPRFVCENIDIQGVFGGLKLDSKGNEHVTGVIHCGQHENKSSENKDLPKGTSSTIDTTKVTDINPPIIRTYCVSTVNDKEAWVALGLGNGRDMALTDINGQVKKRKTMDFKIYDIAVTSEGDLLLTDHNGCSIKKYTQGGHCVDVINTSPSKPWGICMTSHNDILVCLQGGRGGSRVVRLTTQGQVKQTIKPDQDNEDLFTQPKLITENINGDVCVVNGRETVITVNKDGVLRFSYPDKHKPSNTMWCNGITCDRLGFILISDRDNHQIHQVDMDGNFVQFILTEQHGVQFPWGLSIDTTGKLWMCNDNGKKVRVVKYRS